MIPVEQYAARTARLAKMANELSSLDRTWLELNSQFTRLAHEVGEKHHAGVAAAELVAQLALLDDTLNTIEQTITERMTVARAAVTEVGGG